MNSLTWMSFATKLHSSKVSVSALRQRDMSQYTKYSCRDTHTHTNKNTGVLVTAKLFNLLFITDVLVLFQNTKFPPTSQILSSFMTRTFVLITYSSFTPTWSVNMSSSTSYNYPMGEFVMLKLLSLFFYYCPTFPINRNR